jgi:predicted glycoside hydrolase/deacetylase ChbG (UPF0249 family)
LRKLIVNADDFGFNKEITDGIIECHRTGCVTSTTLMANMSAAQYAVSLSKQYVDLSVGVHLNLTLGPSILPQRDIPSLVDKDGKFHVYSVFRKKLLSGEISLCDIRKEFSAQIQKAIDFGLLPTHLDSHHNITVFPRVNKALLMVARQFDIRRQRTYKGFCKTDKWITRPKIISLRVFRQNVGRMGTILFYYYQDWYARRQGFKLPDAKWGLHSVLSDKKLIYDIESMNILLRNLPHGTTEFVAHPGLRQEDPYDKPDYRQRRWIEYSLLRLPEVRELCRQYHIELTNYRCL